MYTVWFKSQAHELSNMYRHKNCKNKCGIKVFGHIFTTSEQAYGFKKAEYHDDKDRCQILLEADNPWKAYRCHTEIKTTEEWHKDKDHIMLEILRAKYAGCEGYRSYLQNCEDSHFLKFEFREATDNRYWGGQSNGLNRLGELHKVVRDDPPKCILPGEPVIERSKRETSRIGTYTQKAHSVLSNTNDISDTNTRNKRVINDDTLIITDSLGSNIDSRKMYQKATCYILKKDDTLFSDFL